MKGIKVFDIFKKYRKAFSKGEEYSMKNIARNAANFGKKALAAFIICLLALSICVQAPVIAESQTLLRWSNVIPNQYGPQSKEELEEFLDGYLKTEMEKQHIPGLMISFVKDGKLLLNKGYGFSDINGGRPVDPQSSLMYVGSVGKSFTAAAIMKLVDEGKVNLKKDVNSYLKGFKLKNNTGKVITVEQLLLHTAGFEENIHWYATRDVENHLSLREYVKNYQPAVVYEPGAFRSYSNYGYTLLGYIIESVSGKSFEEYMREEIFQPLKMNFSTFTQNPPAEIKNMIVKGYDYNKSTNSYKEAFSIEEAKQMYWYNYPAGVLSTNTEELSHFMLFQLNGGIYNDQQIISKTAMKQMQNENFTPHPDLHGEAYGFSNWELNGHLTLQKSGGSKGFSAHMVLFPKYGQGIVYAYNTENAAFSNGLRQAIADRFYPSIIARKPKLNLSQKELKKFEGYYRYTRYNHTTLEKLMTAVDPTNNERVVVNDDGTISVGLMFVSQTVKYEPISSTSFQKVKGEKGIDVPGIKIDLGERIAFRKNKDGKIKYMFVPYENLTCVKISPFGYGLVQIINMATFSLIALIFVLYWPIGGAIKFLRKKNGEISSLQKIASWSGFLSAFSILLFVIILFTNFNESIVLGVPTIIKISLVIPILSIVLFSSTAVFTVKAWQKKFWKLPARIFYTLFAAANLMFVVWSGYYNLIGWQF